MIAQDFCDRIKDSLKGLNDCFVDLDKITPENLPSCFGCDEILNIAERKVTEEKSKHLRDYQKVVCAYLFAHFLHQSSKQEKEYISC